MVCFYVQILYLQLDELSTHDERNIVVEIANDKNENKINFCRHSGGATNR